MTKWSEILEENYDELCKSAEWVYGNQDTKYIILITKDGEIKTITYDDKCPYECHEYNNDYCVVFDFDFTDYEPDVADDIIFDRFIYFALINDEKNHVEINNYRDSDKEMLKIMDGDFDRNDEIKMKLYQTWKWKCEHDDWRDYAKEIGLEEYLEMTLDVFHDICINGDIGNGEIEVILDNRIDYLDEEEEEEKGRILMQKQFMMN